MKIPNPTKELGLKFSKKPILFGGGAMEFYNLRKRGKDVGFIVSKKDFEMLKKKYPKGLTEFDGDLGIMVGKFEFWKAFCALGYKYLSKNTKKQDNFLVISLENQLLLKSVGVVLYLDKCPKNVIEKYSKDVKLMFNKLKGEK